MVKQRVLQAFWIFSNIMLLTMKINKKLTLGLPNSQNTRMFGKNMKKKCIWKILTLKYKSHLIICVNLREEKVHHSCFKMFLYLNLLKKKGIYKKTQLET